MCDRPVDRSWGILIICSYRWNSAHHVGTSPQRVLRNPPGQTNRHWEKKKKKITKAYSPGLSNRSTNLCFARACCTNVRDSTTLNVVYALALSRAEVDFRRNQLPSPLLCTAHKHELLHRYQCARHLFQPRGYFFAHSEALRTDIQPITDLCLLRCTVNVVSQTDPNARARARAPSKSEACDRWPLREHKTKMVRSVVTWINIRERWVTHTFRLHRHRLVFQPSHTAAPSA